MKMGIYQHFKGNLYQVMGEARHSETEELHIVYKPLYGEQSLWIRPKALFDETIVKEGKACKRFAFIADTLDEAKAMLNITL